MARDQRRVEVDRQPLRSSGQLPDALACTGVRRGTQPVEKAGRGGDSVDHAKRGRGRRDGPEQRRLVTDAAQVGQAVASVGEHHRQITGHTAPIVTTAPLAQSSELARERPRQAGLVGDLGEQRAAGVRHQPVSVRRDTYVERAPIACHLQGEPPESELRASATRRIPAQADS